MYLCRYMPHAIILMKDFYDIGLQNIPQIDCAF